MNEQISEDFAKELLEFIWCDNVKVGSFQVMKDVSMKEWKEKGFIKQSCEEEIREKIKNFEKSAVYPNKDTFCYKFMQYQRELIEILDNKIKEK